MGDSSSSRYVTIFYCFHILLVCLLCLVCSIHSTDFNPKFTKSATKSWKLAYKDLFLKYLEQERMLRFDYGTPGHRFLLTPPSWSPDNDGEPLSPLWLPPLRLGMRANEDGDSYAGAFPPPGPTSTWRHPPSRSTLDTWF